MRVIGKNNDGKSGPFDNALFKYLRDNLQKGIYQNIILFRDVMIDLYLYYLSLNDVIYLASFAYTTILENIIFQSTFSAILINNSKLVRYMLK